VPGDDCDNEVQVLIRSQVRWNEVIGWEMGLVLL
jgi:hypothetical protein